MADDPREVIAKTVSDIPTAPDEGFCPYRDSDGFPCELLAEHDGHHYVID